MIFKFGDKGHHLCKLNLACKQRVCMCDFMFDLERMLSVVVGIHRLKAE
jgi:hypothetical protein